MILKIKKLAIITILITFMFSTIPVYAHPGRTDSRGGHTCRTNCEKWGLEYGQYHYHNGGSSGGGSKSNSSSGSSSKSSSNSGGSSSKPATTKPSGPSPEEIAAQDKSKGESEGYENGMKDGYNGKESSPSTSGSTAYVEGYKLGYKKGYEKGKSKLENEKQVANEEGYQLGKSSDELIIPEKYKNHSLLKQSFEDGFSKAREEIFEEKKKEYERIGYEHGLNNIKEKPNDLEGDLLKVYESAFEKGYKELRDKYFQKGYQDAFTRVNYKEPKFEDAVLVEWYKEGFNNNKEVEKIQDLAFDMGVNGEEYNLPEEYKHAKAVFDYYYNLGAEERKEKNVATTTIVVLGILGWLARRFYVARKMLK
jgi:hypothetical protein